MLGPERQRDARARFRIARCVRKMVDDVRVQGRGCRCVEVDGCHASSCLARCAHAARRSHPPRDYFTRARAMKYVRIRKMTRRALTLALAPSLEGPDRTRWSRRRAALDP